MPFANIIVILAFSACFLIASFVYYFTFSRAINDALREHEGQRSFNGGWLSVFLVSIALIAYIYIASPTFESLISNMFSGSLLVVVGLFYLAFEIPYLLVKMAAKDFVEQIAAVGDDKRIAARAKSAEVLADIVRRKLKVAVELQAMSNNDEFVFLTYIINNKPIATRLKLNQADKPENWKKLGEWMIANYQKEYPQQ
jgi:hypothetical protein